jgi:hypothetical protein
MNLDDFRYKIFLMQYIKHMSEPELKLFIKTEFIQTLSIWIIIIMDSF